MGTKKTSKKKEASNDFIDEGLKWLGGVLFDGPAPTKKEDVDNADEETEDSPDEDTDETENPAPKPKPNGNRVRGSGTGTPGGHASAPVNINISGLFRESKPVVTKRKPATPAPKDDTDDTEGETEGE